MLEHLPLFGIVLLKHLSCLVKQTSMHIHLMYMDSSNGRNPQIEQDDELLYIQQLVSLPLPFRHHSFESSLIHIQRHHSLHNFHGFQMMFAARFVGLVKLKREQSSLMLDRRMTLHIGSVDGQLHPYCHLSMIVACNMPNQYQSGRHHLNNLQREFQGSHS